MVKINNPWTFNFLVIWSKYNCVMENITSTIQKLKFHSTSKIQYKNSIEFTQNPIFKYIKTNDANLNPKWWSNKK
jgi:hypothetical protein